MTEDEGAPKMRHWSRGEVIALVGLFAAFISMVAAVIVVPDVRQWMGLEKPVIPSPISPPQSNGPTAPPNPARTARPERLRFVAEGLQRNDDRGLLLFLRRNSGKSVYLNVKFLAKCNTTTGATLDEVQTD